VLVLVRHRLGDVLASPGEHDVVTSYRSTTRRSSQHPSFDPPGSIESAVRPPDWLSVADKVLRTRVILSERRHVINKPLVGHYRASYHVSAKSTA
jgi:hypothetical protein